MGAPLDRVGARERAALLRDLDYLDTGELRSVCRRCDIPWMIQVEDAHGRRRRTRDADRKAVVLTRLRAYLVDGERLGPTVIPSSAVSETPLPQDPGPTDRLHYGQYDKTHEGLMSLLGDLTDRAFRNGAVARLLCMDFWRDGRAPTIAEFAAAWIEADRRGLGVARGEHPEAAYLTDRARGTAGDDWRARRAAIAARTLATLATLVTLDGDDASPRRSMPARGGRRARLR